MRASLSSVFLISVILGSQLLSLATAQAAQADGEGKKFYQLTNKEAVSETRRLLETLQQRGQEPAKANPVDNSAEAVREDKHDAEEPQESEEEQKAAKDQAALQRARQELALDDSMRNIPQALEGYLKMYEDLKLSLAGKESDVNSSSAGDRRLKGAESELGAGEGINGTVSEEAAATGFRSLLEADPYLEFLGTAAFELAVLTLSGLAGNLWQENATLGLELLKAAADAGSVEAHLALSNRYLTGSGMEVDCELAFLHGREAAEHFIDQAELAGAFQPPVEPLLLRDRWRNADFLEPLPGLLQQAGHQDVGGEEPFEGNFNLFELLHRDEVDGEFGAWQWLQGMPAAGEDETTLEMLRRLAARGDPEALFNLGYMHLRGIEMDKNATAAYLLFTAAMMKGSAAAYNALGVMYHNGQDVPTDHAAARQMFEAGAELGDVDSMFNLGTLHLAGHGVEADEALALEFFKDANDNQHWQAPFQLALMHQNARGTQKDCKKAMRHLNTFLVERAPWHDDIFTAVQALDAGDEWKGLVLLALVAEQGSTAGQHNLAFALETSKTFQLPERFALAIDMYLRSGAAGWFAPGLTDAAHLIWDSHKFPSATGSNRSWALALYEEASRQGDVEATFYLAKVYEGAGAVAKRNVTRAAELYWKAVQMAPSERFAAAPLLALILLRMQSYKRLLAWLLSSSAYQALHWDLAILSALASGLAAVLWLRWQRQRAFVEQQGGVSPG